MQNKAPNEQCKIMNEQFNTVCTEYPELEIDKVKDTKNITKGLPYISELEAFKMLKRFARKSGSGDLHRKILQEFQNELALPYSIIVNKRIYSGTFPDEYN